MIGLVARRLSVLVAGATVAASVATTPVAVDAAALIVGPQPSELVTPVLARPDLQVTARGAQVDDDGNTVYTFSVKNVGAGLAQGVKVTKLSQTKQLGWPQKVKNTITVLEYDEIASGQEKTVTVTCEQSDQYACKYASVDVEISAPEASTENNFAVQSA